MADEISIVIGGKTLPVERARLKLWFELEGVRERIREAAEEGDTFTVSDLVCAYLSAASSVEKETFETVPWFEVAIAFSEVLALNNSRIKFPIFDTVSSKKREDPWDYKERDWFNWLHMIAKVYGWSVEYISNLEIEIGFGLLEEILVDIQLDREWQYGLSEIAYPYNPSTKRSEFRKLPRPSWMQPKAEEIKKTKIRRDLLPIGNVINVSGMGLHGTDALMH